MAAIASLQEAGASSPEPGTDSSPESNVKAPACAAPATDTTAPANNAISAILATTSASPAPAACLTAPGEPSPAVDLPPTPVPTAVAVERPAAEGVSLRHAERRILAEDVHVTQPLAMPPPSSSQEPAAQLRGSIKTPRSLYCPSTLQPPVAQQPLAAQQPPAVDRQLKASVVTGDNVRLVPYCGAHVPRVHKWKQDLEPHYNPSTPCPHTQPPLPTLAAAPSPSLAPLSQHVAGPRAAAPTRLRAGHVRRRGVRSQC